MLIETSGLADPAPILHALITDPAVVETHSIDGIVTLVDPIHGAATLDRHVEARRQVALADRLVFSKTDIAAPSDALRARVATLNPGAAELVASSIDIAPALLFGSGDDAARAMRLATLPEQAAARRSSAGRIATASKPLSCDGIDRSPLWR